MPKYPMVEPYAALLENTVESTELDCGCVIWRDEFEEATLLYFCTLHDNAQQLLGRPGPGRPGRLPERPS